MRTLTLLGILFVLLVTAFRQPEQSFPDAASETASRALEMVSGFTSESRPALKNTAKPSAPPPVTDTLKMLKTEVAKLKENFRPSENSAKGKGKDKPSNIWVMPSPSKTNAAPAPVTAPVKDVEVSVLGEPSAMPDQPLSGKTIISGSEEQEGHEEIARLLEEAARNLDGIK